MGAPHSADVVVIGLGAMGSAALYQLARRGVRALGIDRFRPPHDRGSSHGESRITRQAIGEGEEYVPFALRSHEIWRALEAETGHSLFSAVGGLVVGRPSDALVHGQPDFVGRTIAAARRFGIDHEVLAPDEVAHRFPPFRLVGDETCYFEPGAGFVRPERCIDSQLDRARALGAALRLGERVTQMAAEGASVSVVTTEATYAAARVIVTAGAWLPGLLGGEYAARLRVCPQTLYWFEPDEAAAFAPERFPIFIWRHGEGADDYFYGFPVVGQGVKLATEQSSLTTGPDETRDQPTPEAARSMHATHVRGRLPGVSSRCLRAVTCLYTVTPDFRFAIDRHPRWEHVLVASPCSGHGFKHSAAIGEALAEWAINGTSRLDLSPFSRHGPGGATG
jgi:sarcosine oxidase